MRGIIIPGVLLLLLAAHSAVARETGPVELKDPHFGEALYYARQGEYFDAIARLDSELKQYYGVDEPQLDSLHFHINEAEFSVGDFELYYRMHNRAGRAIRVVIEGNVPPRVRNEAIYRLARIFFQKEQNTNALETIERIEGDVPPRIVNDIAFLRAQIYLANGMFAEAERILLALEREKSHEGFASYNLAVAQFAQDKEDAGIQSMARAGRANSDDRAVLAIKDRANMALGSRLLEDGRLDDARQYLERVRLDGPFSNRALLGLGWADVQQERHDRALVPWNILIQRNVTDASVQEAMLGVPYSYGRLGLHGRSALMYGSALEAIGTELDKLELSIRSIREGKFLEALVREEIKVDEGWVIRLRELEQTPETYYLMELLASHDFQSSLKNYLDLELLRKRLESWEASFDAFEDIIALRRQYYEPLLPGIDEQFRRLDSRIRLRVEQRDRIDQRLKGMLVAPNPELLATADERIALEAIKSVEQRLGDGAPVNDATRHRIDRLKGVLLWSIHTEFDERLTETFQNLYALDEDIARLQEIYESFVRTRQEATQSYQGYDEQIRRLRANTQSAMAKVKTLMARQGHMLEQMAVNELIQRRQTLEASQIKARFAMAESYDRATMGRINSEDGRAGSAPGNSAGQAQ
jgi:tetratricopeptide (TPR) repeat protein